jgi:hypothetical protein
MKLNCPPLFRHAASQVSPEGPAAAFEIAVRRSLDGYVCESVVETHETEGVFARTINLQ